MTQISISSSRERRRSEKHPLKLKAEIGKQNSELYAETTFLHISVVILCCPCVVLQYFAPNRRHFHTAITH